MKTYTVYFFIILFLLNSLMVSATTTTPLSTDFIVRLDSPLVLTLTITHPVSCFYGLDGAIALEISGGTAPYQIEWNPTGLPPSTSIQNLGAGNYWVQVTDAAGLSEESSIILSEPYPIAVGFGGSELIHCYGDSSGSITVLVYGENPPFSFLWSNGQTGNPLINVPANAYSVTVTNTSGCTGSTIIPLFDPPSIEINAIVSMDNTTPVSGSINLTAYGGQGGYTYQWSGPNNFSSTDKNLQNLFSGTYTVTITDLLGCTYSEEVFIDLTNSVEMPFPNIFECTPNPAIDNLTIQKPANSPELKEIRVVSIQGKCMITMRPLTGLSPIQVNISALPTGIYYVFLQQEGGSIFQRKIMKFD